MKNNKTFKKNKRHQKRPFLSLILILFGTVMLIFLVVNLVNAKNKPYSSPLVTGKPNLRVDKNMVDLGNVKLGEWVTVTFKLTNVGDQALDITDKPYVEVIKGC